jgi:integrase
MLAASWAAFTARMRAKYSSRDYSRNTRMKMMHVLETFGSLEGVTSTTDLTDANVDRWKKSLGQLARNTVYGYATYLRSACTWAVDWDMLERSPFARRGSIGRKAKPAPQPHHSAAEIQRVLDYLRDNADTWRGARLEALVAAYAFTGGRRNEILLSRVEDWDLKKRVFLILDRTGVKTFESAAAVPILDPLAEVLERWLPRVGSPWFCPSLDGKGPWTGGNKTWRAGNCIKAAGEAVGVYGLTIKSFRTSFASIAEAKWGLSTKQIRMVLRHASDRTQDHYCQRDVREFLTEFHGLNFKSAPPAESSPSAIELAQVRDELRELKALLSAAAVALGLKRQEESMTCQEWLERKSS